MTKCSQSTYNYIIITNPVAVIFSQSQYMDLIVRNVIYTLNTGRVRITILPRKKIVKAAPQIAI